MVVPTATVILCWLSRLVSKISRHLVRKSIERRNLRVPNLDSRYSWERRHEFPFHRAQDTSSHCARYRFACRSPPKPLITANSWHPGTAYGPAEAQLGAIRPWFGCDFPDIDLPGQLPFASYWNSSADPFLSPIFLCLVAALSPGIQTRGLSASVYAARPAA